MSHAGVVWCGVVWCGVVWCGVVVSKSNSMVLIMRTDQRNHAKITFAAATKSRPHSAFGWSMQ